VKLRSGLAIIHLLNIAAGIEGQIPSISDHGQSKSALFRQRSHVELQAQCVHDFDNRRKAGVALLAQSLLEPFAGDAGVAGRLHHAARLCNVANGFGE
jgi:hypothetical protein